MEPITKVIFRIDRHGKRREVIAAFPAMAGTNDPATCSFYVHYGQHGHGFPQFITRGTRLAKPAEYRELAQELRRIGYRLKVVKRFTRWDTEERRKQCNQA
jgi:hypothetical protein